MWIDLDGLANLRDVGGIPTIDGGKIIPGRLLRSDNLQTLTTSDVDQLLGLGLTDVIDLRTLMPWDKDMVLDSVRRTRRCLIVHEDLRTGGFGAEIAAVVADEAFLDLDAPVARVTMPDIPSPHHPSLMEAVLPSAQRIRAEIDRLVGF